MLLAASLAQPVQAALISAEAVARHAQPAAGSERQVQIQRIHQALERAEVRAELERRGVTPQQTRERVAALTDTEVALLAERADELPAGGVIGAILLVFFVLLLTDILGFTKVFPFTRPVR